MHTGLSLHCNQLAIFDLPLASFSERVLRLILWYDYNFSFTCKLNSFSYEWSSTRPRFQKEAKGNSEMAYWNSMDTPQLSLVIKSIVHHIFLADLSCKKFLWRFLLCIFVHIMHHDLIWTWVKQLWFGTLQISACLNISLMTLDRTQIFSIIWDSFQLILHHWKGLQAWQTGTSIRLK